MYVIATLLVHFLQNALSTLQCTSYNNNLSCKKLQDRRTKCCKFMTFVVGCKRNCDFQQLRRGVRACLSPERNFVSLFFTPRWYRHLLPFLRSQGEAILIDFFFANRHLSSQRFLSFSRPSVKQTCEIFTITNNLEYKSLEVL